MFFGFDLKEIFYFPVKDAEARKHLLIGALISISAFVIPILPYFLLVGYAVQIARQVLRNESPRMVAWDNWSDMFKDGAKVFGVRIVYTLPIIILVLPLMVTSFLLPIVTSNSSTPEADPFFAVYMGVFALTMCILIPISIVVAFIVPAAEMHVLEKGEFSAGFRIREWWAIFRANLSGFIAAFAIYYLAAMALGIIIQIMMVTVILACLLPIVLPATTIYILLIMYVTVAQAYRDGKAKLAQNETQAVMA
ncbi:MAG: DUF4013 domain-containing protein, partial [Chloroflexi bacterium]|nr:DUF4013 domain-containing protein [Chloroflexota bacterium]